MKNYLDKNSSLLILFGFVVIFFVGFGIGRITEQPVTVTNNKVLREDGYTYISPVLLCNINDPSEANRDAVLQSQIQTYLDGASEKDVSVFYLDFHNGKWMGISENENFSPASMLKVPTMVAIYHYADSHPGFLNKEIYYDGSFDDNKAEYFKSGKAIKPGQSYTLDTLIDYMINYSDNNATRLLDTTIPAKDIDDVYNDLRIQLPSGPAIDFMSTKTYALFLRLLYNSTYLTREMSEKALKVMVGPDFPEGLVGGVPSSVEVAQKFGEREILAPDGTIQSHEVHDCGIVYGPSNNTYILCVMTRGKNFDVLASEIKTISKITYDKLALPN